MTRRTLLDDSMGDESLTPNEQNDISRAHRAAISSLDDKHVARPQRWQHAPALHPQSQGSGRAQYFPSQLKFKRVSIAEDEFRRCHDLEAPMHDEDVGAIFPHDKAVVTKTS